MSEPRLISPMLDNFMMGDPISEHHGVRCCPAMRKDSDSRYIVKIISVPASQVQLDALLLTGAYSSHSAALSYFKEMADEVTCEADILKKLSKFEGFLPYEDYQVVPMEGAVGYDVYLLSPYKRTLERYLKSKPVTHLNAVNMGLDLCASMAMCRRAGFLYVDLKPTNIYVNDKNEFCIGDLGFVRLNSLKYASLPDKYRSAYTAPEIQDAMSSLNSTIDIYAIGMILYEVYNDGKLPKESELASLTAPVYADYEMAQIILKACDPDPTKRWQDPLQMGQALVAYMQRNSVNDTPIVPLPEPVLISDPEPAAPEVEITDAAPEEEPVVIQDAAEEAAAIEDEMAELTIVQADSIDSDDYSPDDEEGLFDDEAEDTDGENGLSEEAIEDMPEPVPVAEDVVEDAVEEFVEDEPDTESFLDLPQNDAEPEEDDSINPFDAINDADDLTDLSFMDSMVSDETVPQEDEISQIAYDDLSDDASSILSIADELIAHDTPEPVVAPEPIDVPIPDPIELSDEDALSAELAAALQEKEQEQTNVMSLADFINNNYNEDEDEDDFEDDDDQSNGPQTDNKEEYDPVIVRREKEKKSLNTKLIKRVVITAVIIALAAALFFGAYYYYNNYYLQSIDEMTLTGYGNQLTVELVTNVDQPLLTIECTDTYGSVKTSAVKDGKAVFTDLNPNTLYTVKVTINGFHELIGDTTDSYTTPAQTTIVSFHAIAGSEDGSVILNFTVDGQDSTDWIIDYSTEGEEPRQQNFTGHMVTISGLTLDKSYTFRLSSPKLLYIVGKDALSYTATSLVLADNLAITACNADGVTAEWNVPEGATVNNWTVRCYNDQGYDETLVTDSNTITFAGIDPTAAYTVEVTAEGMTVTARAYVSANSATISNFRADESIPGELEIAWDTTGVIPADGWLLLYNLEGYEQQDVIRTSEDRAVLKNPIPGETYQFQLQASDGTTVFSGTFSYTTATPEKFAGHGVSADNMTFTMCLTPEKENWSHRDVKESEKTNQFSVGQKASFIAKLDRKYNPDNDMTTTIYIIRNSEGRVVSCNTTSKSWSSMWYKYYCEMDIPSIPAEAGEYTIAVYFDYKFVHEQSFTVIE